MIQPDRFDYPPPLSHMFFSLLSPLYPLPPSSPKTVDRGRTKTKQNGLDLGSWVGVHLPLATRHGDIDESASVPAMNVMDALALLCLGGDRQMDGSMDGLMDGWR